MATMNEIHVEGHKLAALALTKDGPGPPVILLHGVMMSVHFWTPDTLAPFSGRGPCFALSLPGHYPAVFPPDFSSESLTAERFARVLSLAIRQLAGDEPVVLAGHSTGGFAALAIASLVPEIARCVISISGFARGRWTGLLSLYQWFSRHEPIGQLALKCLLASGRIRTIFRASLRYYVNDPGQFYAYPGIESLIDHNLAHYRRLSLDAMAIYFSAMQNIDISSQLSAIVVPTLLLTGDRDPVVPPEETYAIAKEIPGADLVTITGAGHATFWENPTEYQQAVGEWLGQQSIPHAQEQKK